MIDTKILDLKNMLMSQASLVEKMVSMAISGIYSRWDGLLKEVRIFEERVNQIELDLEIKCITAIALYQPEARDLRLIMMIMKINNDLERLGDQAVNIAESVEHLVDQPIVNKLPELEEMKNSAFEMLKQSLDAFAAEDVEKSRAVCDADDAVDELNRKIFYRLMEIMKDNISAIEPCLHLLRIAKNLERIADLSTNIAENTVYMAVGKVIKHNIDKE